MQIRDCRLIAAGLVSVLSLLVAAGCTSSDAPAPSADTPAEAPPAEAPPPAEGGAPPLVVTELFVDVEAVPDEGSPPLAVQFTAMVEDNTGAVECEWDFGDGSPKKKGTSPTHVYSTVEDYEIIVRCTDEAGVEGEGEIDVFVEEE